VILGLALVIAGCAAQRNTVRPPAGTPAHLLTATKEQLIEAYDRQANSIRSIDASVSMKLTAGSAYSGLIKQYHEISGFILAQKPASIRVIGQAPIVGTTVFDMASDGTTFHMYIPPKNTFLEGPAGLEQESAKPIENLRPQHLVEAIFWNPIPRNQPILFAAGDEAQARYYILTVAESAASGASATGAASNQALDWQVDRRIWFDRVDLNVARLEIYTASGEVRSDIRYSDWHGFGNVRFPQNVVITRPQEGYQLQIRINKLTANQPISPERFEMKQPAGTKLVRVGRDAKEPRI
jgi:hypothetical protein